MGFLGSHFYGASIIQPPSYFSLRSLISIFVDFSHSVRRYGVFIASPTSIRDGIELRKSRGVLFDDFKPHILRAEIPPWIVGLFAEGRLSFKSNATNRSKQIIRLKRLELFKESIYLSNTRFLFKYVYLA